MGGLFIAVVLAFPRGLAGLVSDQLIPRLASWRGFGQRQTSPAPAE
jgi:urea transport system permease protein